MGFVVVYDITNPQSFLNVRDWLEQLRTHAYSYDPVVILVGNKTDLAHERKIDKGDAERLAVKSSLDYIETSAKSGENVGEAMDKLLDLVWEKMMKNIPALGDPQLHSLLPCESIPGGGQIITDTDGDISGRKGCCGN
jgi:Ras-related protein Rab-27A